MPMLVSRVQASRNHRLYEQLASPCASHSFCLALLAAAAWQHTNTHLSRPQISKRTTAYATHSPSTTAHSPHSTGSQSSHRVELCCIATDLPRRDPVGSVAEASTATGYRDCCDAESQKDFFSPLYLLSCASPFKSILSIPSSTSTSLNLSVSVVQPS